MAFNLNKNDESASKADLSKKTSSNSKFDLSKNDATTTVANEKPKSNTWLYAVLGVLLLGGGAWYFMSNNKSDAGTVNSSPTVSTVDSPKSATPSSQQTTVTTTPTKDTTATPSSSVATSSSPAANPTNNSSTATNSTSPAAKEATLSTNTKTATTKGADVSKSEKSSGNNSNNSKNNSAKFNNKVPASFNKASASFSNLDKSLVKDIITYLEKNSNAIIAVSGYASSEGELSTNQQLSQSRAEAFKQYLVSKGITENRIVATGKGIDNPIGSNDTEDGRKKNRRVEISLQ